MADVGGRGAQTNVAAWYFHWPDDELRRVGNGKPDPEASVGPLELPEGYPPAHDAE